MSYESSSTLPATTRESEVRAFVELLGYRKGHVLRHDGKRLELFSYFDDEDYHSWTGVEFSLLREEDALLAGTRTPVGRSYYDLVHQNETISALKKRFGGSFVTDEGRGRYLRPHCEPPAPAESGCYLAYGRFRSLRTKAVHYHESRKFAQPETKVTHPYFSIFRTFDPRTTANNALIPYLVAALEDYFKSTFVALLRYSPRKESFFKNVRLQGDRLLSVAEQRSTVEDELVELLPFQKPSAIFGHFRAIDPKLDIAGALRKPYRRRRESLLDTLEALVATRHQIIHRAIDDLSLTDKRMAGLIADLDVAVSRVYEAIVGHYGWSTDLD